MKDLLNHAATAVRTAQMNTHHNNTLFDELSDMYHRLIELAAKQKD